MKERYEKESFSKIVSESYSIAEVSRKLGLRQAGGAYSTIAKYIKKYELDTSHFTGQCWNFEKAHSELTSLIPLEDILKEGTNYKSHYLKLRLVEAGIKEYICEKCGARADVFGHAGAEKTAEKYGVDFLGAIPLHYDIRVNSDSGTPIVISSPESPQAQVYSKISSKIAEKFK